MTTWNLGSVLRRAGNDATTLRIVGAGNNDVYDPVAESDRIQQMSLVEVEAYIGECQKQMVYLDGERARVMQEMLEAQQVAVERLKPLRLRAQIVPYGSPT